MTKKEALALQALVEKNIKAATGEEVEISLALTGRLKINFGDNYITLNREDFSINYMRYVGSFDSLMDFHKDLSSALSSMREDVDKLIWSYENRAVLV